MTMIQVTQTRGLSHKPQDQRLTLRGLGLRRVGHTVTVKDTPAIRGMVEKVQHLVDVKVLEGEAPLFGRRHTTPDGKPKAAGQAKAAPKKAPAKKAAAAAKAPKA
jgi:large subunit ribosomal protein L30